MLFVASCARRGARRECWNTLSAGRRNLDTQRSVGLSVTFFCQRCNKITRWNIVKIIKKIYMQLSLIRCNNILLRHILYLTGFVYLIGECFFFILVFLLISRRRRQKGLSLSHEQCWLCISRPRKVIQGVLPPGTGQCKIINVFIRSECCIRRCSNTS